MGIYWFIVNDERREYRYFGKNLDPAGIEWLRLVLLPWGLRIVADDIPGGGEPTYDDLATAGYRRLAAP